MVRVAIISNSVTPYRVHLHQRIVQECQDLELWSIFTHEFSNAPWKIGVPEEIRPVFFGAGEDSLGQGIAGSPIRDIRKATRIVGELKLRAIDAVILFGYNDLCLLGLLAWCRYRKIPCFVFGDSNVQNEARNGIKMRLKRALLPRVLQLFTGAMFCGRMGADYFAHYGVPLKKLFPFPYEPDYKKIAETTTDEQDSVITKLHMEIDCRRILYSGRLVEVKRVDLLITAFQNLARDYPGWNLIIAGDGEMRDKLAAQIDPALRSRIQFLGFINDPCELAAVYSSCDVLVLPSDVEPWGVVVTEAATRMALVCSSQVGAAYDLVEDHRNGCMFPAGDAQALTQALREVMHPDTIDVKKAASPLILAKWRARTDPVAGLRQALSAAGFLIPI